MLLGTCKSMGSVMRGTCAGGRRKGAGSTSVPCCLWAGRAEITPALALLVGDPLRAQQANERKAKPSLDPPGRNLSPWSC